MNSKIITWQIIGHLKVKTQIVEIFQTNGESEKVSHKHATAFSECIRAGDYKVKVV